MAANALRDGYAKLSTSPADADIDAAAARKAERNTEKVYRAALKELFEADDHINALSKKTGRATPRRSHALRHRDVQAPRALPAPVQRRGSARTCGGRAARHRRPDRMT
jgi:hypothetical protein